MSVFKLTPDNLEFFTVTTHPTRQFVSSSNGITTGSVFVFPHRSSAEKFLDPGQIGNTQFSDQKIEAMLQQIKNISAVPGKNLTPLFDEYMSFVHQYPAAQKYLTELFVNRYTPTLNFSTQSIIKNLVRNTMFPYHRFIYPTAHWAYTNYNCLNFFTGTSVDATALIYPNTVNSTNIASAYVSGSYVLTGAFAFEFYINPRYKNDPNKEYTAGTIFHLSSSYAVSLVSGSQKDINGQQIGFRLKLQLSHSADIAPHKAKTAGFPNDLIFQSDDNSLQFNNWHHCVIRWGASNINEGTGSFVIDGITRGTFNIPSSSVGLKKFATSGAALQQPAALLIGNFYDGPNGNFGPGFNQDLFFTQKISQRDGIQQLNFNGLFTDAIEPGVYQLSNSLNAEIHELRIWNRYLFDNEIISGSGNGLSLPLDPTVIFYVPPLFTKQAPYQQSVNISGQPTQGGILSDFAIAKNGETVTPFNPYLSLNLGVRFINLENFTRDFVTGQYPRLMGLNVLPVTESLPTKTAAQNDFYKIRPALGKRNLTILPCDDGGFKPNFNLLTTGTFATQPSINDINSMYVNDFGFIDRSLINLQNITPPIKPLLGALDQTIGTSMANVPQIAFLPPVNQFFNLDSPSKFLPDAIKLTGALFGYESTQDTTSNEVIFFDISNMFYGNKIMPGSVVITDSNLSGSGGRVSLTFRDDGYGNLYRADCLTSQSMWNSIGNVLYDEGMIVIKSPHVGMFGQDYFNISFTGEQNIHTMKLNIFVPANSLNSSSNPTYSLISASFNANDSDSKFVYLTGMNFHDEDFNVIMRTQFAQPFVKRQGDKILIKVKHDW